MSVLEYGLIWVCSDQEQVEGDTTLPVPDLTWIKTVSTSFLMGTVTYEIQLCRGCLTSKELNNLNTILHIV